MKLYRIAEFPEVWSDACLRDSEGRFLFLSLYGRDGSLMQLLAAMELGAQERGVQHLHLENPADPQDRHMVSVGAAERLSKHACKLPRQNLFGPLNHMWVFDKSMQQPDRANRIGWAMHYRPPAGPGASGDGLADKAWQLIGSLSPVALLEHWRPQLLAWCQETGAMQRMDSQLYPAIGPVQAVRVSLTEHFVKFISDGVRSGALALAAH